MGIIPEILVIFAAFGGFILAAYLHHKKLSPEPMVCPLKGDCSTVIRSEYSSFFGVPVEWLGMAYYAVIAISYGVFLSWPELNTPIVVFAVLSLSTAAVLFSAYLTFIQIGFLKQICTWCLMSAGISAVIFAAAIWGADFSFISLLQQFKPALVIVHLTGLAMGVGGATFANVFFFKFLKDLKISQREADVLNTISQVIWFGLALLVISGIGLYLNDPERLNESSKFLTRMVVVSVMIVNGAFLNLKVTPHLIHISFGDDPHKNPEEELRRERKIAFSLGGISLVSWYSALILGALESIPLSFPKLLSIYILLLIGVVIGSQIMERLYGKQLMPTNGGG